MRVLENDKVKILWDLQYRDENRQYNRPDLIRRRR